jgi:hypothetical protein
MLVVETGKSVGVTAKKLDQTYFKSNFLQANNLKNGNISI